MDIILFSINGFLFQVHRSSVVVLTTISQLYDRVASSTHTHAHIHAHTLCTTIRNDSKNKRINTRNSKTWWFLSIPWALWRFQWSYVQLYALGKVCTTIMMSMGQRVSQSKLLLSCWIIDSIFFINQYFENMKNGSESKSNWKQDSE